MNMLSLFLTFAAAMPQDPKAEGAADTFEAPGVFTVADPEGADWKRVRAGEVNGVKFAAYYWQKEGTPGRAVITVEGRVAATDAERSAAVKTHWNNLASTLERGGFKAPEPKRPNADPPIPDRVDYSASAEDPNGVRQYFRCATLFGQKNTYLLQAIAPTEADADALIQMLGTFKELP
jgi:hypothetical protein